MWIVWLVGILIEGLAIIIFIAMPLASMKRLVISLSLLLLNRELFYVSALTLAISAKSIPMIYNIILL